MALVPERGHSDDLIDPASQELDWGEEQAPSSRAGAVTHRSSVYFVHNLSGRVSLLLQVINPVADSESNPE